MENDCVCYVCIEKRGNKWPYRKEGETIIAQQVHTKKKLLSRLYIGEKDT